MQFSGMNSTQPCALLSSIMLSFLGVMALFYYTAGYFVLRYPANSKLYFTGVAIVLLISINHALGGFSLYIQNVWYFNSIIDLSIISVLTTIMAFGHQVSYKLIKSCR
jgi:hypothetical protein